MGTKSTHREEKRIPAVWHELDDVCKKIHYWLYEKHNKTSAKQYQDRLLGAIESLPKNDLAILRAEGLALLHELKGEQSVAIKHRKREIKLMKRLHDSVKRSIEAGDYDAEMGASILQHWDGGALKARQAILKTLEDEQFPQRNGMLTPKSKAVR